MTANSDFNQVGMLEKLKEAVRELIQRAKGQKALDPRGRWPAAGSAFNGPALQLAPVRIPVRRS